MINRKIIILGIIVLILVLLICFAMTSHEEVKSDIIKTNNANVTIGAGYYVQEQTMDSIDFELLKKNGVNVIFLNSYAIEDNGRPEVESFIKEAHAQGIQVHLWIPIYNNGSFISPVDSDGEINYDFIYSKINEIKEDLPLGFDGVHLDYVRFPGNAYNYTNGEKSITTCVLLIDEAVKKVNSNLIVSLTVMPETYLDGYYYGQNFEELSGIVDLIVPMAYAGNYNADSNWLSDTMQWFRSHSKGAEVWAAVATYDSDANTTMLPVEKLTENSQKCVNGGSLGVVLFRAGLSNDFDFSNLDTTNVNHYFFGFRFIQDFINFFKLMEHYVMG